MSERPRRPAKIAEIKRRKKPSPRRYPIAELRRGARHYYLNWTGEELREKASKMAVRLLAIQDVLQSDHGTSIMNSTLIEMLTQLSESFLKKKSSGWNPRQSKLNREDEEPWMPKN